MLNTQKVAITIPQILIKEIDIVSKKKGLSRSRYITEAVYEKIENEKKQIITDCYDEVFSDTNIQKEQLETSKWFNGAGDEGGQEW